MSLGSITAFNETVVLQSNGACTYTPNNVGSGRALECRASTPGEGNNVRQYTDNGLDWQRWTITLVSGNQYKLVGKYNPRSLTANGIFSGTNATVNNDTGTSSQRWILSDTPP